LALDEPLSLSFLSRQDLRTPERVSGLGGLRLNREKSMLEPMQVGQWLGFVLKLKVIETK